MATGVRTEHAKADADLLIVKTAIKVAATQYGQENTMIYLYFFVIMPKIHRQNCISDMCQRLKQEIKVLGYLCGPKRSRGCSL